MLVPRSYRKAILPDVFLISRCASLSAGFEERLGRRGTVRDGADFLHSQNRLKIVHNKLESTNDLAGLDG
jgi:hypothetical protein